MVNETQRRILAEWWQKEYLADRMRLCIIGKGSLNELSAMTNKLFSPIRGRDAGTAHPLNIRVYDDPFGKDERGTLVSAQKVENNHVVEVSFSLTIVGASESYWRRKPFNFVAHFIGHKGPGSLCAYLQRKGWVVNLACHPLNYFAAGFVLSRLPILLTEEGFNNYKDVIITVFKYLSMMRSSALPKWYQQEIATLHEIHFQCQEEYSSASYAQQITDRMIWPGIPRDQILSSRFLVEAWNGDEGEQEVREILDSMRLELGRVFLSAKREELDRLSGGVVEWKTEPIYGTQYHVQRFDAEFISKAPNDIRDLYLPEPNKFIPTNVEVDKRKVDKPVEHPTLVYSTPLSKVWHKKDDYYWVPRASVAIDFRSPVAHDSPRASAMTTLFTDLATDSLAEYSHDANLAGLSCRFQTDTLGPCIVLCGYNDKLDVLAKAAFERARSLVVTPEQLQAAKAHLIWGWRNLYFANPHEVSDHYMRYIMTNHEWLSSEKVEEIPSITLDEFQAHVAKLFDQVEIRNLTVGNISKEEAIGLMKAAERAWQCSSLPESIETRMLVPPGGVNAVWEVPSANENELDSSLSYYVYLGDAVGPHVAVIVALLRQILSEAAFNILRTREQLGYTVECTKLERFCESDVGILITVQSERAPAFIEEQVDAFLVEMTETLECMTEETLNEHKHGLERRWMERPGNLYQEGNRFWHLIDSGCRGCYNRQERIEILRALKKEELIALMKSHVHPDSPSRSKLAVHLKSQKVRPKHISEAAITAFASSLSDKGITVGKAKWREDLFFSGEPALPQAIAYWRQVLADKKSLSEDEIKTILQMLPKFADEAPASRDYEGKLREGTVVIKEPKEYRAMMRLTSLSQHVMEYLQEQDTSWGP